MSELKILNLKYVRYRGETEYNTFCRKKFPEDDLHEMFPEGSGELSSENFEPNWFLLEHHHATSFDDLKVGLLYLKRKVESQKEGQLSFLKVNIESKALPWLTYARAMLFFFK